MALLAMLQTGIDGFVAYIFLVKGWGYPIVPIFSSLFESLQDLAPLLDALREASSTHNILDPAKISTISCHFRSVLLHLEDLAILYGHLRQESQAPCRCYMLCPYHCKSSTERAYPLSLTH